MNSQNEILALSQLYQLKDPVKGFVLELGHNLLKLVGVVNMANN